LDDVSPRRLRSALRSPIPTARLLAARVLASLAWAVMALSIGSVAALSEPEHAALVIDANTGAVLHEVSPDAPRHPASLTKMMTLYLVFEQIEAGRMSYATRIKVSQEAASASPSKLDLEPGEQIETLAAIKALITKSANDVAVALAEHIAGSEAAFARLMTARARQIGMRNTVFRNASGLPDAAQVTTARDMITLALRLQDEYPRHYGLFRTRSFAYEGNSYRNHNTLLANFQGTDGIKTGYTRMSGFNLVASAHRGGRHVIGAVFGGASAGSRDAHMRVLLTRAFPRAGTEKTRRSAPMMVARARPAPRPVPALRPKPEPRMAASAPPAPPMPVEIGRGRLTSASQETAPAITPPRPQRVMVPPLQRNTARPPGTAQAAASPDRTLPWLKPSTAARETPAWQAVAPSAPARQTAITQIPVATVSVGGAAAPRATGQPTLQPFPAVGAPGRGLPPSSLQAQAERLALGGPGGAAPRIAAPAPLAHEVPARAGLEIQVGAFPSSGEAERQIATVRSRTGSLLTSNAPRVMPVRKDNRQLYRARFTGFEAKAAAAACLELRRLAVDCFVMRAE